MAESKYEVLPPVSNPGRDWTAEEMATFPLWARVCYAVHGFNTRIRDFEDWMQTFGPEGSVERCSDCGLTDEGRGSLVKRLLAALDAGGVALDGGKSND